VGGGVVWCILAAVVSGTTSDSRVYLQLAVRMRFYSHSLSDSHSHSHSATDRSRERDGGSWGLVFVIARALLVLRLNRSKYVAAWSLTMATWGPEKK